MTLLKGCRKSKHSLALTVQIIFMSSIREKQIWDRVWSGWNTFKDSKMWCLYQHWIHIYASRVNEITYKYNKWINKYDSLIYISYNLKETKVHFYSDYHFSSFRQNLQHFYLKCPGNSMTLWWHKLTDLKSIRHTSPQHHHPPSYLTMSIRFFFPHIFILCFMTDLNVCCLPVKLSKLHKQRNKSDSKWPWQTQSNVAGANYYHGGGVTGNQHWRMADPES